MVGLGADPPSFLRDQEERLTGRGIELERCPPFATHRYLNAKICQAGSRLILDRTPIRAAVGADVIHYQWPGHYLAYRCLSTQTSTPAVLSLRGRQVTVLPHLPNGDRYRRVLARYLPRVAACHCVSRDMADQALALGAREEQIWVIPPAADCDFFRPNDSRTEADEFRIAMIGRLVWAKGHEYGIEAIRVLRDKGIRPRVRIVGPGPELDRVKSAVKAADLEDHVTLSGPMDRHGIRELLWDSDALLHPSVTEGIPNAVLEAMACALPVVVTDVGGIQEVVENGSEGFICRPRAILEMAEKLEALTHAEMRENMGRRARKKAIAQFDAKQQTDRFVSLYQTVSR